MTKTLEQVLNFDEADLASNRLGQLTQKQRSLLAEKAKSHKTLYTIIGIFIVLTTCGGLITRPLISLLTGTSGSFLQNEGFTPEAFLPMLPAVLMGGFFFIVFGAIILVVLRLVFEKANRKVDTVVRRAEGKVNFVWVEKQERNTTKTGPTYKTVRVLEMRLGGETFTVNHELPNVINQGEEWIFYYANHPFKFLSAEQVK